MFQRLIAGTKIEHVQERVTFDAIVGVTFSIFGEHDCQQIVSGSTAILHYGAFYFVAAPNRLPS